MELYLVFSIVDRARARHMLDIYERLHLSAPLTALASGTATMEHLSYNNLEPRPKALVTGVASTESLRRLLIAAKRELYIDIPGNGVLFAVPVKAVAGKKTLSYLTDQQNTEGGPPQMDFKNELIVVLLNEGHWDSVMDVARAAGATGGTVLHAKGTGRNTKTFFGLSLVEEKDVLYILAEADKKTAILQAIARECGPETKAGAICFSLPVTEVAGIRGPIEEEAEQ